MGKVQLHESWLSRLGEEEYKGRIAPGFLADLAVLDANPLSIPGTALKDVRVVMTVVGGTVVFERPAT